MTTWPSAYTDQARSDGGGASGPTAGLAQREELPVKAEDRAEGPDNAGATPAC